MIVFHKLTFANFLSVGNTPVTIDLDATKTTLVHGTNGSGKSTILDALCYSLFNKPFRKVNLPQLLNTQNKKGLMTEVEFSIGKNKYVVQRGMKPKRFQMFKNGEEIDAKAADKDNQAHLEQNILKLTYKSFTQVVILGSSNFVPFMQLAAAGRRECIEDFLDIKVFSTMGVIAKERLRGLRDNLNILKGDISNLEYKRDLQLDRIRELQEQSKTAEQDLLDKIENLKKTIKKEKRGRTLKQKEEQDLIQQVETLLKRSPEAKVDELKRVLTTLRVKMDNADKRLVFFRDNDECHHCGQPMESAMKEMAVSTAQKEGEEIRDQMKMGKSVLDEFQRDITAANVLQQKIQTIQREVFQYETLINTYTQSAQEAQEALSKVQGETQVLDKEEGKLEAIEEECTVFEKRKGDLENTSFEHELVVNLLKDSGIKTQIVKKYLPVMNKCIRKYLALLDLNIHFVLDEEFNESVSSPLHQDFSYASFSEGQKGRIDLALMFTWREVSRLKNTVSTNLLVLDEVFSSSLDEDGKEKLMALLRYRLDDNQRILVVDHTLSQEFKDKFDRTIEVSRVGGFSRYA